MKIMHPEQRDPPMVPSPPVSKGMERSAPMVVVDEDGRAAAGIEGIECVSRDVAF